MSTVFGKIALLLRISEFRVNERMRIQIRDVDANDK